MGEYATFRGSSIKIGTCENMYYLRAQDAHEIEGYDFGHDVLEVIRFRFPFPSEDGLTPGSYDNHEHGVRIPGGYMLPEELSGSDNGEHGNVQFRSDAGYVLSIPCPEGQRLPGDNMSTEVDGIKVGRNGFRGYPVVRQQAYRNGCLVTLLYCGACGAIHRLDTIADAAPVAEAFIDEAERKEWHMGDHGQVHEYAHSADTRREYAEIASRILAGYKVAVPA